MATVTETPAQTLMERVALTRLRRFEEIVAIAEQSDAPLWRTLARIAARAAMRDCLLAASSRQPSTAERAVAA